MAKIIGIDLGTTNSCVAILEGKPRVIEQCRGCSHHPFSWPSPRSGIGGQPAKRQAITNPKHLIRGRAL